VFAVDLKEPGNAGSKLSDAEKLADGIADPKARLNALAPLLYGYRKANKTGDVERLIGKAGELAAGISDPKQKISSIRAFARKLIEADCKEEAFAQLQIAADVARKIEGPYDQAYALTDVAEQYAYAGEKGKMEELLKEVDVLATKIEGDPKLQTKDRAKRLRQGR
jgi:hypothetical protein